MKKTTYRVEFKTVDENALGWPYSRLCDDMKSLTEVADWLEEVWTDIADIKITEIITTESDISRLVKDCVERKIKKKVDNV